EAALDQYLSEALIPALDRQGIGPVGVFSGTAEKEPVLGGNEPRVIVAIPYDSADQVFQAKSKLAGDEAYQSAAKAYLQRAPKDPAYKRIQSELMIAMDCMKTLNVPAGTLDNDDRVYELRLYESANEHRGDLKVEMFNNGEVPIFLDCGIQPIFIAQCVVGPQTPSLSYLTVYPNEEARLQAWKDFRVHPDWKVLSKVAKYKGTVSHIDKFILKAKPYSKM
ncbi:MAG: NIPSNAP family protein, partial [Planctomycetota bacterium]